MQLLSQLTMKLNLTEYILQKHLKTRGEHTAVILVDDLGTHRKLTYKMLYHEVCCLAAGLKKFQLPKGTVICIQADDVYELLLLFLATNAVGWVPNPLILGLSAEECNYILRDSNARLFFCLTQNPPSLPLPTNCQLVKHPDYVQLKTHPFQELHTSTTAKEAAFIFYTSGSSGHPKGVLHAQQVILGRKPSLENWLTLIPEDVVMQTDNLCWTYSMFTGFLDPLVIGATAIVLTFSNRSALAENLISPEQWLAVMQYYQVSVLVSTPNIYHLIVTSSCFSHFTNHSLRQAGSAGAFLVDKVQHLWMEQLKLPIFIALGMSEISTFISTGPKVPYHKDRLGKIQPGRKVAILPIEGGFTPVPINSQGMLAIHRDELGLMLGYIGHEKDESYKYRGDWFLTQDVVSIDADGYIQYHGRADMIIKVDGGFRVSIIEIENQLKLHPTVLDAACTTIFNKKNAANQLVAYIISAQINQKAAEELSQFLKRHLSDYKVPNYLYFVEHLPLSNRGKVIRTELTKLIPVYTHQVIN